MSGPERSPASCANETVSGCRYQPFAFGGRSAVAAAVGGVESYLIVAVAGALVLPALSVHVPEIGWDAASGPE